MICVVVRRDDGDLSAVAAEVVDEHQRGATDAVDGAKGLGAQENPFAPKGGGEL